MAEKKVKIITFIDDREGREDAEIQLGELINNGWVMVTAGGGGGAGLVWGFVVLQHDDASQLTQDS